ncbi:MAG TPA: hypothetical protein VL307_00805 [Chitinophagaceae bacterium]|nr:hypothetical protein [Chitinophagaceae bacterium]
MPHRPLAMFCSLLMILFVLQSCSYSIVLSNKFGTAATDPLNHQLGFYNGKSVQVIDTVVPLSLLKNGVMAINACPVGGFHSVEYKIRFGDMLRNTFSFGKRKAIRVKYVCLKNSNE